MKIKPVEINSEIFSKFGKVVKFPKAEPTSEAVNYKFWSDIVDYHIEGETEIGRCTVYKQPKVEINGMERHLKTPEILIPVDGPFVIPLLYDDKPEKDMEAFMVCMGEAVVINKGIWHAACLPVDKDEATYFVIFRKNTPFEDVEKKQIAVTEIEI
jgi:ureidoglycolate lyase